MKFEGPTPETETRQVSVSFAAFIIVTAFALFGLAMAIGTVTGLKTQPAAQPEVTAPQPGFESAPAPAPTPLPAVTQPDPTAMTATDPANPEQANADTPFAAEQAAAATAAAAPAAPPAVVAAPAPAAKAPASETAPAAQPAVQTHNPSFPSRHVAPVAAATAPQPAQNN
ncbi:hypothetical protein [Aquisediminimonas profunda]|uniref:hypothetical protein n=1 Tax=Aquisediminimonas profunda TaxID=1550733 RepID=UPI001C636A78|nr:hypothetical protein [Aquisediminimonas profunda]